MAEVGVEPTRNYSQGILSQLTSSIEPNSGHVSPRWTTDKHLVNSHLSHRYSMIVDADDVDCCDEMSHECPTDSMIQNGFCLGYSQKCPSTSESGFAVKLHPKYSNGFRRGDYLGCTNCHDQHNTHRRTSEDGIYILSGWWANLGFGVY